MKRTVLTLALVAWAAVAEAHKPSDSYLRIQREGDRLSAQWDIALRDLDYAIGLDADGDGSITWGELRAKHSAIAAYALARLQIDANGATCRSQPTAQLVDRHSDGAYSILRFDLDCPSEARSLDVRYRLFFDLDPQHRGLLRVEDGGPTGALLFTPDQPLLHVQLTAGGPRQTLRESWRDGMAQVWVHCDHALFLLALLLPAVLARSAARRSPLLAEAPASAGSPAGRGSCLAIPEAHQALPEIAKITAAFAIAHSLTLSGAWLETIRLPSQIVEPAIAASVLVAALSNAIPALAGFRWVMAFGFGLLHGFGFAGAPALAGGPSAFALFGFNAGVETGQLAVVGAFLLVAYGLRKFCLHHRLTLVVGSSLIALVAAVWLFERAVSLRLLPT